MIWGGWFIVKMIVMGVWTGAVVREWNSWQETTHRKIKCWFCGLLFLLCAVCIVELSHNNVMLLVQLLEACLK